MILFQKVTKYAASQSSFVKYLYLKENFPLGFVGKQVGGGGYAFNAIIIIQSKFCNV